MPSKFKALATLSAWVLFIGGCLALLGGFIGVIGGPGGPEPAGATSVEFRLALGVATIILSVCAMKLRQMME